MKIATVTLNPAIDQTVRVNNFRANTVNRGQAMQFNAGGKGVNVASFLADSGHEVAVTGFLGQDNAEIFERFFARKGIADHFVRIPGETRTGVKIVDEARQRTTDINMPGLTPPSEAIEALFEQIEHLAASCDWFVLAGALPPGVPDTLYATIIARLKELGKHVALDTSGQALRQGVLAGPTVIKPNIDELQELSGRTLANEFDIELASSELMNNGIKLVVVSMGERGAMFIDEENALVAVPPAVTVKSTVGAGDALVAGLLAGLAQNMSLADCARLATAYSLGRITGLSSRLPDRETLQAYFQQVTIHTRNSVSL
jgi:1-phosphofructokinase